MNRFFHFVLIMLFLSFQFACNETVNNEETSEQIVLSESQSLAILNSDESQNFLRLRDLFTEKVSNALNNGYSPNLLKKLSMRSLTDHESESELLEILFGNKESGKQYLSEFQLASKKMFTTYPLLNKIGNEQESETDVSFSIEKYFDNFIAIDKERVNRTNYLKVTAEGPVCGSYWRQLKLLTCAGLCGASTAGAGAVLCGWACWCWFCNDNSELAEVIC